MTTKYDKTFDLVNEGLEKAERDGLISHDIAQDMRKIVSDYLDYLEDQEEKEYQKLCEVVPSFHWEAI